MEGIIEVDNIGCDIGQRLLSLIKDKITTMTREKYKSTQIYSRKHYISKDVIQECSQPYNIGEPQILKIIEVRYKFIENLILASSCNIFVRSSDECIILGYALIKPININLHLGLEMFEIFVTGENLGRKFYDKLMDKYLGYTIWLCNPRISVLGYWDKLGIINNIINYFRKDNVISSMSNIMLKNNSEALIFLKNNLRWDSISIEYIINKEIQLNLSDSKS